MSDIKYALPGGGSNGRTFVFGDVVNPPSPYRPSAGLQALLDALPASGDVMDLDDAVAIVARHQTAPYIHIVVGMNQGLLSADFLDCPWIDGEVVIRRV